MMSFGKKLKAWFSRSQTPSLEERLRLYGASEELQRRYDIVTDSRLARALFQRLASHLKEFLDQHQSQVMGQAPAIQLRLGRLPGGESFLYLQSWSEPGCLIEMASHGWLIAEADYIAHEHRFMRARDSWEAVTIMSSGVSPEGERLLRISSSRWPSDLMSYPIYFDRLCAELPLLATLRPSLEPVSSRPWNPETAGITTSRLQDWS